MNCPNCGQALPNEASFCPVCGFSIPIQEKNTSVNSSDVLSEDNANSISNNTGSFEQSGIAAVKNFKNLSDKKKIVLIVGVILLTALIGLGIRFLNGNSKENEQDTNSVTESQNIDNQTDGSKAADSQFDGCFHDGEAFVVDGEKNERLIVAGYTHSHSEGVQFTIPLSKYFGDMELNLDELKINIRHSTGGLLLGGYDKDGHDVLNDSRFTVVTKKVAGCYVTINVNYSEGFGIADQAPVTITIHNMRLTFSDKNE